MVVGVFFGVLIAGNRKATSKQIILESKPGNKITWLGKIRGISELHTYEFETINEEKVRVTTHSEFSGLLLPLTKRLVSKKDIQERFVKMLNALKIETEKKYSLKKVKIKI